MKLFLQIFFGLALATNCLGQINPEEEKVKKSVISFYNWYIGMTKSHKYAEYVKGVNDGNGKTKLETKEYFKRLDSLGVIGQEFIESEKLRFKPCSDFLKTVPWTEFSTADNFPYEDKCDFFYYYFWTYGQEPHDGVEVKKVAIDRNKAFTEVKIYFGNNKSNGDKVLVWLSRINNTWMITKIQQ